MSEPAGQPTFLLTAAAESGPSRTLSQEPMVPQADYLKNFSAQNDREWQIKERQIEGTGSTLKERLPLSSPVTESGETFKKDHAKLWWIEQVVSEAEMVRQRKALMMMSILRYQF
jgi:hypothetical protein